MALVVVGGLEAAGPINDVYLLTLTVSVPTPAAGALELYGSVDDSWTELGGVLPIDAGTRLATIPITASLPEGAAVVFSDAVGNTDPDNLLLEFVQTQQQVDGVATFLIRYRNMCNLSTSVSFYDREVGSPFQGAVDTAPDLALFTPTAVALGGAATRVVSPLAMPVVALAVGTLVAVTGVIWRRRPAP